MLVPIIVQIVLLFSNQLGSLFYIVIMQRQGWFYKNLCVDYSKNQKGLCLSVWVTGEFPGLEFYPGTA